MWKTLLKRYTIIVIVGIIISLPVLYYIDVYVLKVQATAVLSPVNKPIKTNANKGIEIPDEAKNLNITFDGKKLIYIFYSQLTLKDIANQKETVVEDIDPVVYQIPLETNKIAFITNKKNTLTLKEYNNETNQSTVICKFMQQDFNGVKDLTFDDGVYYVTIQKRASGVNSDIVYRIKSLKDYRIYASSATINKLCTLNVQDSVVYEDSFNNIYINKIFFSYNKMKKFKLLGTDENNNIYLNPLDDSSNVIVVNDKKVVETKPIEDSAYEKIYNTKQGIYLSYTDYYYDLINSNKYEITDKMELIKITNNGVIYKDSDGKILIKNN